MLFSKEDKNLLIDAGFTIETLPQLPEFAFKSQGANGQLVVALNPSGSISASFDDGYTERCEVEVFNTVQESLVFLKNI